MLYSKLFSIALSIASLFLKESFKTLEGIGMSIFLNIDNSSGVKFLSALIIILSSFGSSREAGPSIAG